MNFPPRIGPSSRFELRRLLMVAPLVAGWLGSAALAGEPGKLTREVWNNIAGGKVEDLTALARFHGGPDVVSLVGGAAAPSNAGSNYGQRLRGYVTAPVTGDYTFWESGDDSAELLLSPDTDKFGAERVAWHGGWTGLRQWDKFATQQSAVIRLAAGQKCYMELRHKEDGGADHLALAWAYDEVQPAVNLALLSGAAATQSSTYGTWFPQYAIDGNTGGDVAAGDPITHTQSIAGSWWQVDLGALRSVDRLVLWNREDWNGRRLCNFRVSLLDEAGAAVVSKDFYTDGTFAGRSVEWGVEGAVNARTVRIERIGPSVGGENFLTLAEVEVFGVETPQPQAAVNLALQPGVLASQSSTYGTWFPEYAIDGLTGGDTAAGDFITHTLNSAGSWWQADLGAPHVLEKLILWNREGWNGRRLANFRVSLLDEAGAAVISKDFFTDGTFAGRSVEWVLEAPARARSVKIERIGPSVGGENFLTLAEVEIFGTPNRLAHVTRGLVAASALESYDLDPLDLDDDDLLDAWELVHGFDTATWQDGDRAFASDSDRDYLTNYEESRLELDPFQPDSIQGRMTLEQRLDIPYYSIRDAAAQSDIFYQQPDRAFLVEGSTTGEHALWFCGQRLRGYLVAPETGNYRFWLSATNGARLQISSGPDKFHKRIIAEMGPELGTGHGTNFHAANKWDLFVSQMSEEIHLEAGQSYFIEVLHQHGHGHYPHADIAWARPGGQREEIPGGFLYSYFPVAEDADDDSLPDAWEAQYGLSVTDNGLTDRAREGEFGDFDGDGLTNPEEFKLGTNPALADSDGDGLADADEVRVYGTDPLVSDAGGEQLVGTVPPSGVFGLGTDWTETAGGVLTTSFRGRGTWDFTVPEAGYWVLQVETLLRGDTGAEESIAVEAGIDGSLVERAELRFINNLPGSLRIVSPYLAAGGHQLELFIDNYTARVSVEVTAIKVLRPGGLDLDGDGRSDAVESRLAALNLVSVHTLVESHVSPAFIEGRARVPEAVELRAVHDGPGSTVRHKDSFWAGQIARIQGEADQLAASLTANPAADRAAAGATLPVLPGAGHVTWYVGIPLQANQATRYTAFFENGSLAGAGVVVWRPLNLIGTTEVTIPLGSDLLMSAWDSENDNSKLDFTIGADTASIRAKKALPWNFATAGDHLVSVTHQSSGIVYSLTVHVREASLPQDLVAAELRFSQVGLPAVASDLAFDTDGVIGFDGFLPAATGTGSVVRLMGRAPGIHRVAVRQAYYGPVLDVEPATVVGVSDALRNLSDIATPLGAGLYLVRSPLLLTYLPPGATVKITIFAGGVTFADGTTVKTIAAADLDENGLYMLELIMPAERTGAPCHNIEIFDAQGRKIYGP